MTITTVSARDFTRGLANAKKAASGGPVFVTDRGRPPPLRPAPSGITPSCPRVLPGPERFVDELTRVVSNLSRKVS